MASRIESEGVAHGLSWACVATRMGHRCGYVRVPEGHPLHGLEYDVPVPGATWQELENVEVGKRGTIPLLCADRNEAPRLGVLLDVHGSVTFTGDLGGYGKDGWWIGFDCNHSGDAPDPALMDEDAQRVGRFRNDGAVRDREYVEAECVRLAEQVAARWPMDSEASAAIGDRQGEQA